MIWTATDNYRHNANEFRILIAAKLNSKKQSTHVAKSYVSSPKFFFYEITSFKLTVALPAIYFAQTEQIRKTFPERIPNLVCKRLMSAIKK